MPIRVDLAIINADIRTMNSQLPQAEAMAIANERIIAIGPSAEIEEFLKHAKKIIDCEGRTIIPGFIDTHSHLASLGEKILHLDLGNTQSIREALQLVKQLADDFPEGKLILGYNWDESKWETPRYITKEDLDPLTLKHPVVLIRVCGHLISVNSVVLEQLKLDPDDSRFDRDEKTGEPTGVLRDFPVDYRLFQASDDDLAKALREGCQYANSVGITSLHENLYRSQLSFLPEYFKLRRQGKLTVRVYANMEEKLFDLLAGLQFPTGFGDDYFRFGGVKVFIDGSLGAQTAAISEPYLDKPDSNGLLLFDEENYEFLIKTANQLGLQVSTHAIGDRAIELVLRVHEKISTRENVTKLRHNIIHAEFLTSPLMKRVKQLDMLLLQQPNFVNRWGLPGGMYDTRLGPKRAKQLNNFRRIIDAGIKIAFGSDNMPMNPLYGIYSAITHPYPSIQINLEEAIRLYTIDAAFAGFDEDNKGSLALGKLADFIILSQNPYEIDPLELMDVKVLATYVGGRCVFSCI